MIQMKSPSSQDQTVLKIAGAEQAQMNFQEFGFPPCQNDDGKLFTRDEIREHILMHVLMDPQPNGKRLSKRLQAENALLELIASSFDVHERHPDDIPF